MTPAHALSACLLLVAASPASAKEHSFSWQKEEHRLALKNHDHIVWQFVFDPAVAKPHFHPLATVDGEVLTGFQPADHPWHRGLWWSWKYINGVNYWEENRTTGLSAGLTRLVRAEVVPADDFSATAHLEIHYHPPGEATLLAETRHLTISAPDANGTYNIGWKSTFSTDSEAISLDRTLPPHLGGPNHGGYAGLSLRLAKDLDESFAFHTRHGPTTAADAHGKPAPWIGINGPRGGIAIFDHPENPCRKAPWYAHNSEHMCFFSPSPLFNEPLDLCAGTILTFNYRVLIHSKPMPPADINTLWQAFTQSPAAP